MKAYEVLGLLLPNSDITCEACATEAELLSFYDEDITSELKPIFASDYTNETCSRCGESLLV